jgi:hypothetical protein
MKTILNNETFDTLTLNLFKSGVRTFINNLQDYQLTTRYKNKDNTHGYDFSLIKDNNRILISLKQIPITSFDNAKISYCGSVKDVYKINEHVSNILNKHEIQNLQSFIISMLRNTSGVILDTCTDDDYAYFCIHSLKDKCDLFITVSN